MGNLGLLRGLRVDKPEGQCLGLGLVRGGLPSLYTITIQHSLAQMELTDS